MERSTDILNELREISPIVAQIDPRQDLFELPSGYFNELADKVISRIRAVETESFSPIGQADKNPPFSIPGNYFESFAEKLMGRIRAEQADSAAKELEILSPILAGMEKKNPYHVPPYYFAEFSSNIMERVAPLAISLKDKRLYEVPDGYFDELPGKIMQRIKGQEQPATIISFGKKRVWLKYAVAAAVAGAVVTTGVLVFNPYGSKPSTETVNSALAKVSDDEIVNYLDAHNVPFSDSLNITAYLDPSENEAKDLLGNVSDEELQQYIDGQVSKKELMNN